MSDRELLIYDQPQEFITSLPEKRKKQLAHKIISLRDNEHSLNTKLLVGFEPLRRLRAGDYRVVYFVADHTLHVVFIDNRNDDQVYRKLKRMLQ